MQVTGVLFAIPWILILLAVVLRCRCFHFSSLPRTSLALLFLIKLAATLGLQMIYTYYYPDRSTADIYRFFDDGLILQRIFHSNPIHYFSILTGFYTQADGFTALYFDQMNSWIKPFESGLYNDNRFMIRLHSLMAFVSGGFYEVHSVFFSFFAFLGLSLIVRALLHDEHQRAMALIVTAFLPSYLLWCSGGLKETVLILGMGLTIPFILHYRKQHWLNTIASPVIGMVLLLSVKLYYLGALSVASVAHWLAKYLRPGNLGQWVAWTVTGGLLFLAFHLTGTDIVGLIVDKQQEFLNHAEVLNSGSYYNMERLGEHWLSVLLYCPTALYNTLLRPLPWQINSAPELLLFLENIYLWLFVVLALYFRLSGHRNNFSYFNWAVQFVLPVLVLIGMTTPVLGALMRYRAPAIIIVLCICVAFLPVGLNSKKHSS